MKKQTLTILTNKCDQRVYRNLARCSSDCKSRLYQQFVSHEINLTMKYWILNGGSFSGGESLFCPFLEQQMLRAVATEERLCRCTLTSHHNYTQLCLKVFIFWHNHLSGSVFVRTRTLSLLMCKICSPMDHTASSFLLRVGLLTRAQGRTVLLKWQGFPALRSHIMKWPLVFSATGHISARVCGIYLS